MTQSNVDQRGLLLKGIADFEAETKMKFIRTWSVHVPDAAASEIAKTLSSKWLNTGVKEREFRAKAAARFGARHVVACNSGTAALVASLKAIGVGPGDEVVTTPYTFIATNTSVLEVGAKPVFADINYATLNIDPESVRRKITPRTKAIIAVHYGGLPVDLDRLRSVAAEAGVPLIEDSAHAMGSAYRGVPIGAQGDFVTFSFQVVKIVTCGDGGLVCTTDPAMHAAVKRMVWYGVDRESKTADPLDPLPADITELGLKANMNDITATLGCVAMDSLDEMLEVRRRVGETYRSELAGLKRTVLVDYGAESTPNYQIFPVHVDDREKFAEYMFANGVQVNVNNRRNDRYTVFGGLRADLPNLERADADTILLPCHGDLSDEDVRRIARLVQSWDKK